MLGRRSALGLLGASLLTGTLASEWAIAAGTDRAGASFADVPFAGLTHYRFVPARADELVRTWETGLLAAARQAPGFVEGLLLLNRAEGHAIAFGVFATKADADIFGATEAFRQTNARIESLLSQPASREEYEVYPG